MSKANIVIQTAFLGDLLLSIPLLKKCREMWPEDKLLLVCRRGFGDLFLQLNLVDHIFEIKKGDSASYDIALEKIQNFQIQNLVSPHQSLRTCLFSQKIRAQSKTSFKNIQGHFFYKNRISRDLRLPDAIRQQSLLIEASPELKEKIKSFATQYQHQKKTEKGFLSIPPLWASMSMRESLLKQKDKTEELLSRFKISRTQKVIAVFPGSVWATKRWTQQGFKFVVSYLLDQGFEVLVMGGPGEEELCAQVAQVDARAKNICAQTSVYESALILSNCTLAVGNDSASMHLAAMADIPIVSIFGPTVLSLGYRPWSDKVIVVEVEGMSCRPCGKHGHKKCPIKTHACMEQISPKQVIAAIENFTLQ